VDWGKKKPKLGTGLSQNNCQGNNRTVGRVLTPNSPIGTRIVDQKTKGPASEKNSKTSGRKRRQDIACFATFVELRRTTGVGAD